MGFNSAFKELISALGGGEGSTSRPGRFTPGNNTGTYLIGG